jgi:hypothetical protein
MYRAFSIDRIPAGRIGAAEKLYFQADADGCFCCRQADNALNRLPGRTAGSPPVYDDIVDLSVRDLNFEFRSAKAFFIVAQTALPGKTASRGG